MSQRASDFFIAAEQRGAALDALRGLSSQTAFCDWYGNEVGEQSTFEEAMASCAWEVGNDQAGNVVRVQFIGDKSWGEELIFAAIAPFVRTGSYIEMQGEDGAVWRWSFSEGTASEIRPTITWDA